MILAALGLDISGFQAGMNKVTGLYKKAQDDAGKGGGIGKFLGGASGLATGAMAGIGAAVGAVTAAAAGMWSVMGDARALAQISAQAGISTGQVLILQKAFTRAGLAAEDMQPSLSKMSKGIADAASGSGTAKPAFEALGLSAQKLANMAPDEAFRKIGSALTGIQNPIQRAQLAMEIFGKSGARMLSVFANNNLEAATKSVGTQAALMDKYAGVFMAFRGRLESQKTDVKGFFTGLSAGLIPSLMPFVDGLKKIDLTHIGAELGIYAAMFVELIKNGNIGSVFEVYMTDAANALYRGLIAAITGVATLFLEELKMLTNAQFWTGMLSAFLGIASSFSALLLQGVARAMIGMGGMPGFGEDIANAGMKLLNFSIEAKKNGKELLQAGKDNLGPMYAEALTKSRDAAKAAYQSTGNLVDVSGGERSVISNALADARAKVDASRAAAAERFKLGAAGSGEQIDPTGTASKGDRGSLFSSLAKIGGSAGPGGADPISIQRDQLVQARLQVDRLNQTNILLQIIAQGGNRTVLA
jgi:hypothetical protein